MYNKISGKTELKLFKLFSISSYHDLATVCNDLVKMLFIFIFNYGGHLRESISSLILTSKNKTNILNVELFFAEFLNFFCRKTRDDILSPHFLRETSPLKRLLEKYEQ